jgi:hypothetical protein
VAGELACALQLNGQARQRVSAYIVRLTGDRAAFGDGRGLGLVIAAVLQLGHEHFGVIQAFPGAADELAGDRPATPRR